MAKLLVADDSTTIQRVVELTFAGQDIEVVAVGDGDQAIARIPLEHPDIVLADIAMPKRDGYQVSAFVKGHRDLAHVPVLLLAGAFDPVDDARARDARSDGVIVKPFDPRQMVTRVRELLAAPRPAEPSPVAEVNAERRSLDDYFNHLDHALQTRAATKPDMVAVTGEDSAMTAPAAPDVPTVESLLERPAADVMAQARDDVDPSGSNAVSSSLPVSGALDTRDGGEVGRSELVTSDVDGRSAPVGSTRVMGDDLVDEITSRVLERLAHGPLRDAISTVVREVIDQRRNMERQ